MMLEVFRLNHNNLINFIKQAIKNLQESPE
jgi:hypothetical protein